MKNTLIFTLTLTLFFIQSDGWAQYICVQGNCINGMGKKQVKDSPAFLQGKFKDGILQEGKALFPNGDVFTGKFKDHKLTDGIKVFSNGSKLQGTFVEEVLVDGIITYEDGSSRRIKLRPLGGRL